MMTLNGPGPFWGYCHPANPWKDRDGNWYAWLRPPRDPTYQVSGPSVQGRGLGKYLVCTKSVHFYFVVSYLFFDSFHAPTANIYEPILAINGSKDVFWLPLFAFYEMRNKFYNLTPILPQNPLFWGSRNVFPMGDTAECCEGTGWPIFAIYGSNQSDPRLLHEY